MNVNKLLNIIVLIFITLPIFGGCYRAQMRNDGNQVRSSLIDMYTDQAMDNLVRAHQNLPFVQLDFHDLLVQATDQYTGTFTNTQPFDASRSTTIAGTVSKTLMRSVGSMFSFGGTAQRQDLLSFKADPVTNQDDIYVKYLTFAKNPELFRVSDRKPNGNVHLMRKFQGCYYYVPCEAAPIFLDLVLRTTLMRGPDAAPPTSYPVTLLSADETSKVDPSGADDSINANLHFDTKVPNGKGLLVVKLDDGRKVQLAVDLIVLDANNKRVPEGSQTDTLQAQWSPIRLGFTTLNLKNSKGQFYSNDFPPDLTTIDTTTKQIKNNLESIRANQSINTLRTP